MEGFHVFLTLLLVERGKTLPRCGIVADELAVVLVAVKLEHIDDLAVRAPGDIGEVTVSRVTGLQIERSSRRYVIDADGDLMAGLSCHWVFVGLVGGAAAIDIYLRIVCHHRLVHAIEGESLSVGTPKGAFLDTELVAVYALSIDYLTAAVGGELALFVSSSTHIELHPFDVSHVA